MQNLNCDCVSLMNVCNISSSVKMTLKICLLFLSPQFVKNGLSGSASQIWCLLRHLAFIIGDLAPPGNSYWDLNLLFREMCEIIFAPTVTHSQVAYLNSLISDHHRLFLDLAPHDFTSKFHK